MRWKGVFLLLLICAVLATPAEPQEYSVASSTIELEIGGGHEEKYVALTFDDGPRSDTTVRLLDGLKERKAAATFFVIGEQIPGNEEIIRRMGNEGHQVGNHTYDHTRLNQADKQTVITEVAKADTLLCTLLGERRYWLRPPYGLIREEEKSLIRVPMIQWTVDPEDWKLRDAEKIYTAVMEAVQPNDVVLLHDFYPASVDAALRIVDALQAQGYTLVTVEQLFALQDAQALPGVLYRGPHKLAF